MSRRLVLWTFALVASFSFVGNSQADFDLTFLEERMIQEVEITGIDFSLHSWRLTNTSGQVDSFRCNLYADVPGVEQVDWFYFLCSGLICVQDSLTVTLGVGDNDSLSVKIQPLNPSVPGGAYMTLRVRSLGDEPDTMMVKFTTLAGVTTLIVEDDPADDDLNSYYRTVADNAGLANGVWDTAIEPLMAGDLDGKESVVWYTGSATSTLSSTEQQIIEDYLAAGGDLLISGQEIAEDLAVNTFLTEVLHAELENGDVASTHVDGVPSDPVGDGLSFDIAGGDGAGNQTSPDGLVPLSGAHLAMTYDTAEGAGIRFTNTNQKLVYLGYGLEGISTQADRQDLFDNVIAWFGTDVTSVDDAELLTNTPLVKAGPNPFSSRRPIAVEFDSGNAPTPWTVEWFDASGRLVDRQRGFSSDGQVRLEWSGTRAGTPLSSGVYMYRLEAGSKAATGRALFLDR